MIDWREKSKTAGNEHYKEMAANQERDYRELHAERYEWLRSQITSKPGPIFDKEFNEEDEGTNVYPEILWGEYYDAFGIELPLGN